MSINLSKGANISLAKEAPHLTDAVLGLGWGQRKEKGFLGLSKLVDVDLDASCLLFDEQKILKDAVWFRQLQSKDGSVSHSGDDRSGGGQADDPNEEILVRLNAVPSNISTLMFTVNSFLNDSFDGVPNAFCILKDNKTGKIIAKYDLSVEGGSKTGLVIAKLYRHNGEWKFKAIGEWGAGRTFNDLMPIISHSL
ncbi:MAG: tellurium resistance protein TerZ [Candidatus Electronema aureum]|uniref:Tellurium resistance protein TerZ n=1 Tax=Candidatus Electronema aureum TaxID=2005002 RepID=A0A521G4C7_9BACT|nr:MAG: tellurium resistance protein TerZ [Candidatus Electronema aureum]